MPAAIAIPLITGGISAGASIYGATKQAGANNQATQAQSDATAKALAFEQQKYSDLQSRIRPWVSAGQTSTQRMSDLLGQAPNPAAQAAQAPRSAPTDPSAWGAPVRLRAPDGSVQMVSDPALVKHYLAKGAERVA